MLSRTWITMIAATFLLPGMIGYLYARTEGSAGGTPGQNEQCCHYYYLAELTGNPGCPGPTPQNRTRKIQATSIEDCATFLIEYPGNCAYYFSYEGFGPCSDTAAAP